MPVCDSLEAMVICQEAKRFQSFYPRIQQLSELLEQVDNVPLKRKMRELVNGLEETFLNSPEFTASKISSNLELRLGIVGSSVSGKSFLVQRYLTGIYPKMESFSGRYKKEVLHDGQSHLLLIRDETGPPDLQFTQWVDAVIFVFSLDDELSYSMIPGYYAKMAQYRNISDVPVILVAMRDGIDDSYPGTVSIQRIKKLINDMKQCVYMEASALTGDNVDAIFQTAIEKLIQSKEVPVLKSYDEFQSPLPKDGDQSNVLSSSPGNSGNNSLVSTPSSTSKRSTRRRTMLFSSKDKKEKEVFPDTDVGSGRDIPIKQGYLYKRSANSMKREWKKKYVTLLDNGMLVYYPNLHDYMAEIHEKTLNLKHTTVKIPGQRPPKASTTTSQSQASDSRPTTPVEFLSENNNSGNDSLGKNSIVIQNGLASDCSQVDGPVDLDTALANVGNQAMMPAASTNTNSSVNSSKGDPNAPSVVKKKNKRSKHTKSCEIDYEELEKALASATTGVAVPPIMRNDSQTSSLKKKGHRRAKSGSGRFDTDTENLEFEFTIISLDGKYWNFEAGSQEERDSWVQVVEQQILTSLQTNESGKGKSRINSANSNEGSDIQAIRRVPGNDMCVDCGALNPDWASLNLGALLCIECSGVHRNLGTHLSRVRSLDLDDWPSEYTAVMCAIGNDLANGIWEGRCNEEEKPTSTSSREDKERWIRAKYESKQFLCELPPSEFSLGEQLNDAVTKEDLPLCILLLAHCTPSDVNTVNDDRDKLTPLHSGCMLGNIVITQLLVWYFADVKALDANGRSPLWHAKSSGSKECADILRYNGCNDLGTLVPQADDVIL
ncbi:arf-GAP with GTPase, ANK repeat and PH domain-containing protein 1-like [Actinia tenebrosa]|uniref:Arf-GAP with GTPase, ANK repeat and PH domain-containing protein 1-like n=1 Tax=Actinia tenebrosa TaxID=6105 RepID=A0A6P8H6Y6_ACTTE|nr:arf-GAP with GTPase, ANK repeat and PH domain-containing protein 1-like [Actinia tenebrosa]